MESSAVQIIPLWRLSLALLPVAGVMLLLFRWSLDVKEAAVAVVRMLVQLLFVGFALSYIFESALAWPVLAVLCVMVSVSAWIGLRTIPERRVSLYVTSLLAVLVGGGVTFLLVTQYVLDLEPWYYARYTVPLAGMIFSAAMTSISLAGERFFAELERGVAHERAKGIALSTALIPITNNMLAVGLVSLPGMMTGQILSGIDPLVAIRYQVVVMCMVYGASGLTAAFFLTRLQGVASPPSRSTGA